MVVYGWLSVSSLVFWLANPPPPSVAPPHVGRDRGWIWRWNILTITLVYLAMWAEDGRAMPIDYQVLSFDSSVTVLRSNRVISYAWIGLALAFVRKVRESSPLFIIYHHHNHRLWGISPLCQPWGESKLFCSFAMFLSNFAMVLLGFSFPFDFAMKIFSLKQVWVSS